MRLAQVGQGFTTPRTPTLWPVECEAEDLITPTEPGRRRPLGGRSYLEDRGAQCAQPFLGGWGRLGWDKASSMWSVKGGCTHRAMRALDQITDQSAPMQRKPRTSRNSLNTCELDTLVDGKGGTRKLRQNNLEESFQCEFHLRVKERQARALPQNLEARCPGSSLTNLPSPHHRAGLGRPMSAAELLRMRSRPDHPRSHHCDLERTPERTGPPSRRKVEAARGTSEFFKSIYWTTVGFYFGSSVNLGK